MDPDRRSSSDVPADHQPPTRREVVVAVGVSVPSVIVPGVTAQEDGGNETADGGENATQEDGSNETQEDGGNETADGGENATQEDGGGGGGTETVTVGPGGDLVFEPETLSIEPGTTVQFVWESDNHNVSPTEQPEDANWEGHQPIENEGFEYEHTFDVEGDYHYVCEPHISAGMEGDIVVATGAAEGGGASGPAQVVPTMAMTVLIATVLSLIAVLSLSYVFLRFGGSETP